VWDAEPGCVHAGTLARTRRAVMISVGRVMPQIGDIVKVLEDWEAAE
jgi:hypothetical protein